MHSKTIFCLASAALAATSPIARRQEPGPSCSSGRPAPTLPINGGDKELGKPPNGTTLKHIALGFGIQNYTCDSAGAEPEATGALAMLYDITPLYPGQSSGSLGTAAFNKLGPDALWNHDVPLNLQSADGGIASGASTEKPFPESAPLKLDGMGPLPFLGHHFFNADSVPEFRVPGIDLLATKIDSISAPSDADKGPEGTGAVSWLHLGAGEGSVGAKHVYRVITSGGNSHGCSAAGDDSTSYTAQYWIYN